ncbi:cysteine methyltransferase [Sulfolobus sp. A20]|uniref:methylated-DNA--[protein]-cysteine S-methyltransferase n=1 Tax=Sulfolobaceae TaxID=118883 RepID=UPI000845F346|nr:MULTISPECIES: methylated-DNA--[protein]-cysteine S-methyltransferase [unclassified Sulfolobus]TRM74873.1 methylated-DNA--[protein]-cysteine S-methyltransferase [Sulfolobus sp. B5]TRM77883.1 methylated-DNA--[protein]-cysteine S-methyltransferase [Sulfolobus sp. A20-N-F8]TRM80875.1 methylated-DNA--[protein]-cysteine S-methyltransferase [Sulfolobus sp. D5]TRM81607.1 methylated-DNA--[protein]-cysteine S-methyltransferase [Sulfolobus sp. F3]TRM85734.1 methylated-DNA--[protein]-cysteine S-methylt
MIVYGLYKSPLGYITIAKDEKGFLMLDFCNCAEKESIDNDVFTDFFHKLDLYFEGKPVDLREPISLRTYPFRLSVYKEVMKIPWGKVETYKQIADRLNTSPRAIGMALSKNPILLIIPCHRVISEKGLGGYSRGVKLKKALLELEGVKIEGNSNS